MEKGHVNETEFFDSLPVRLCGGLHEERFSLFRNCHACGKPTGEDRAGETIFNGKERIHHERQDC
jgi:hypothetical protein